MMAYKDRVGNPSTNSNMDLVVIKDLMLGFASPRIRLAKRASAYQKGDIKFYLRYWCGMLIIVTTRFARRQL